MAVKFLYYFVFAFVAIMVFLLYQKPYIVQENQGSEDEPNIEMLGITSYSITKDGILHIVKSTKVLRFDDHDEFYNIDGVRKSKKALLENLKANSGKLVNNNLSFDGNVSYKNSNSVKFKSQKVNYNLKTKVANTDVAFVLEDDRTMTHGSSLVYNTVQKKVYASKIRSTIEDKKK